MLTHKMTRLMLSLCGIAFSTLVLFMGIGFFNGLNDSQARLAEVLDGDFVMIHKKTRTINSLRTFNRTLLYQALSHDAVTEVIPIYDGQTKMVNPETRMQKTIFLLAFPMEKNPFNIDGLDPLRPQLRQMGTVAFDLNSRQIYGKIVPGMSVKIQDGRYTVAGLVSLGPNFAKNGYLIMGDHTLIEGLKKARIDRISLGIIRIKPGADPEDVGRELAQTMSEDVRIMSPGQLRRFEIDFSVKATPVGALLGIGLIVGFLIGVIISYQILFNEITDHLPQFATLKAVGFSKAYMISIVLKEALLLSVLGFFPGFGASLGLYTLIEHTTKIIMDLNPYRVVSVFLLTVLMCVIAGMLAVKKVLKADPAELF
jgi:putative ABC transport system permease protein